MKEFSFSFKDILLGVGIPFTLGCIKSGGQGFAVNLILSKKIEISKLFFKTKIKTSLLQDVLALFLGISLVSTFIFIPLNRFNFSRRYGIYLLFLYVVALIVCILVEAKVIVS